MLEYFVPHWKVKVIIASLVLGALMYSCSIKESGCISQVYSHGRYSLCNTANGAQLISDTGYIETYKDIEYGEMKEIDDFQFISVRTKDNHCVVLISNGMWLPSFSYIKDVSQITHLTQQRSIVEIHYTDFDPVTQKSFDNIVYWGGLTGNDPPYPERPRCDE